MKKALFSLVATAAITTTLGVTTYAEEITVKKGDTLSHIAHEYGSSVSLLKEMNGLSDDSIYTNQKLTVSYSDENSGAKHIVVAGETLWEISQKYNVSVDQLQSWNGISGHLIYPNQQLIVTGSNENVQAEQVVAQPVEETTTAQQKATVQSQSTEQQPQTSSGETITVTATAYTAHCEGCSGITATGINLLKNPDMKVIAVDPSVIPLGTKVYVEGYGNAIAGDTGGAIKGNKIDVFIPEHSEAMSWGRKTVNVTILN